MKIKGMHGVQGGGGGGAKTKGVHGKNTGDTTQPQRDT